MANSSTHFQQFTNVDSQGWTYNRSGYLSDEEHVFALAIFLMLKGFSAEAALPHLKTSLRKLLKSAISEIEKSEIMVDIKNFEKEMVHSTPL